MQRRRGGCGARVRRGVGLAALELPVGIFVDGINSSKLNISKHSVIAIIVLHFLPKILPYKIKPNPIGDKDLLLPKLVSQSTEKYLTTITTTISLSWQITDESQCKSTPVLF